MALTRRNRTRRNILVAGAAATAAAALGHRLWRPDPLDVLTRRLAALFPEAAAAAATIRQATPRAARGADRAALARATFGPMLDRLARDRPEAMLATLVQAVDADFQAGRVARVEGWTLAQTEIGVMALIALASP
jgi:hypothetical protein